MIELDGTGLTPEVLSQIAAGKPVRCAPAALDRMAAAESLLARAVAEEREIYGVTTGLGNKVVERLGEASRSAMSATTVRGRAHAVGPPMPRMWSRGALAVRLNTLLIGVSGCRPALARHIAACLNAGLAPAVGMTGSIGAADLPWAAGLGLALIGEGRMLTADGGSEPAAAALARAGLDPIVLAPREGLALVSHPCTANAIAALGLLAAETAWEASQTAVALTCEGFRANLGQIRPEVLALRPAPGQAAAGAGLRARLAGSALWAPGAPRRLQDPLSIRHAVQVQGTVRATLDGLRTAIGIELNGAPDSPAVLCASNEVLSQGGYLTPHLTVALGAVLLAQMQQTAQITARTGKMLAGRFTGLPAGLGTGDSGVAGLGPVLKTAEALMTEIAHLAHPPTIVPSLSADGLEDTVTHTAIPAKALHQAVAKLGALSGIEMIVAARAVALRGLGDGLAPPLAPVLAKIASISPLSAGDRPLTDEIEVLAEAIAAGAFGPPATALP